MPARNNKYLHCLHAILILMILKNKFYLFCIAVN